MPLFFIQEKKTLCTWISHNSKATDDEVSDTDHGYSTMFRALFLFLTRPVFRICGRSLNCPREF